MERSRHQAAPPSSSGPHPLRTSPGRIPPPAAVEPVGEGVLETAWRILRHRWLIVVFSVVVAGTLAAGLSASREKRYTATATLLFGTASDVVLAQPGTVDATRVAATNAGMLSLGVVADDAALRLKDRVSAAAIAADVAVVQRQDADLIDVRANTPDPKLSADVANAYGSAFIQFRQRSARKQIEDALALAEEGLAAMTPEQRAGEEGQALGDRINQLETAKSLQTGGAELVQPASVPSAPSSPRPKRDGILGAILGAIFGFALASVRERRDRGVRTVEELETLSGWPVLARIPTSRTLARGAELTPRSVEAEAFRMLRANLRYFGVNTELRSLLITSARSREGKSTTAHRLAETMAAMRDRVVLVEADMHRAAPTAEMDIDLVGGGLSGFLIGRDLDDVLLEVPIGDPGEARALTILPTGPLPPNPSELLESDRMRELMLDLESRFDLVILDSPPLPLLSDASTLVDHVSGAIVVTALGRTTPEDLREVANQMSLLGGDILGVVANFAPASDRYYGYGT